MSGNLRHQKITARHFQHSFSIYSYTSVENINMATPDFSSLSLPIELKPLFLTILISHKLETYQSQSQSHIATDGQSVSMSWCRAQIWDF
jgi:hypothetical protein